jgi:hypothetical protein
MKIAGVLRMALGATLLTSVATAHSAEQWPMLREAGLTLDSYAE